MTSLTHSIRKLFAGIALALGVAGLAGCAGYSPEALPVGASQAEVVQVMGPPMARHALPDGRQRLEFTRGPAGRHTFMVDFDAGGRMTGWEQVKDLWHFSQITPGMSADEVLMRVGHPGETMTIKRQQLTVWNYRYPTNDCLWYQISVGDDGLVISGSTGIDPRCDPPNLRGR